jgi:hypothetical protein
MKQLYRIAQALLSIARLIGAALYATFALLFMWLALWFFLPSGHGEPVFSLTIFFGLWAAMIGVKALEMFLSTRPAERPDERERYLQSRSLYNPGRRREAGRRERES